MTIPAVYGLLSQALIAAATVRLASELATPRTASAASVHAHRAVGNALAAAAGTAALLVPVGECTIAEHMRGVWGDPSVVTALLLALFLARPSWLPPRPSPSLCLGITMLVTLPLYLPVLGATLPLSDLYSLGWSPHALLAAIAGCAALLWAAGRWNGTWACIVAAGLAAYAAGLLESSNLIDHLADPGLLLAIAGIGLASALGALARRAA